MTLNRATKRTTSRRSHRQIAAIRTPKPLGTSRLGIDDRATMRVRITAR
jgi:hypothetical protein